MIDEVVARSEDGKIDYSEFVSWVEGLVQGMDEETKMKEEDLKQLFDLLDRDEDDYLEFSDVLAFIFSMETELSDEEKRIRSFRFYDRYASTRQILSIILEYRFTLKEG